MTVWLEHRSENCTGPWGWWAACSELHPGWMRCDKCGASHRATIENCRAGITENLLAVELMMEERSGS